MDDDLAVFDGALLVLLHVPDDACLADCNDVERANYSVIPGTTDWAALLYANTNKSRSNDVATSATQLSLCEAT